MALGWRASCFGRDHLCEERFEIRNRSPADSGNRNASQEGEFTLIIFHYQDSPNRLILKLNVWIYPEGTRSPTDGFLPFKKGAFHLAINAQVPIVPVVFSSHRLFYDYTRRLFRPGRVIIQGSLNLFVVSSCAVVSCAVVLPPVSTVGLVDADVDSLLSRVRDSMWATYKKLNEELMKKAIE